MPRGVYNRKNGKAIVKTTASEIVPATTFESLPWWSKLDATEKESVKTEGQQLATALLNYGQSKMQVGQHLSNLRDVLEPHNLFGKFLRNFRFSKRTAYRYIAGYKNAAARLPETVVKVAMIRGYDIIGDTEAKPLGKYTQAVKSLPIPKVASEAQASAYLDKLEEKRKAQAKTGPRVGGTIEMPEPQDPQTLLKEAYRFVASRFKKLPNNSKTRAAWVKSLVAFMLTELGVSGAQTISPVAVPEGFRAERGRPRVMEGAA